MANINPFLAKETMTVRVEARTVYGQTLYYPANADAGLFCQLLRTKTLGEREAEIIRALGYKIITITNQPQL